MSEEANVKDEVYQVNFTEWELDVIKQLLLGCKFPGTHLDLAMKLLNKVKKEMQSWEQSVQDNSQVTQKQ